MEIDNFFCSHRCLLVGNLVRGASVLVAPARPATSLCFYRVFAPSTLTSAKVLFLVFLNLDDILGSPPPVLTAVHPELF